MATATEQTLFLASAKKRTSTVSLTITGIDAPQFVLEGLTLPLLLEAISELSRAASVLAGNPE